METTTVLISVFLFALVSTGQATKCEDVDMDCGRLDLERNICADPYDAITLCIRYCGLCTDPAHPTVCEDHDVECPTFANQQFCAQEQAKKLCRKTCNFCHNSTVPGSNPGLTVQGPSASVPPPKATHPPPASNGAAMMEIPDPKCHDVDERCSALIHVHNCMTDHLTQMLCQRSCDLCPYVLVSPDSALDAGAKPNITSQVLNTQSEHLNIGAPVVSVNSGAPVAPVNSGAPVTAECKDYDPMCPDLVNECYFDMLITSTCRLTCNYEPCGGQVDTQNIALPVLPVLKPFTPPAADSCTDHDDDCPVLVRSYYCSKDLLLPRLCPLSCGYCNASSNHTKTPASTECVDHDPECPALAFYCSPTEQLVNRLCKKTCHTCTAGSTTILQKKISTDALPNDCFDLDPKCNITTQGNACEHNDLVARVCPVSCNICNETRSNTTSAGQCVDYDPECSSLHYACGALDLVDTLCPLTCGICNNIQTCHICTDPFCGGLEPVHRCSVDEPYCMNAVINEMNGNRHVTKMCATQHDCVQLWVNQSATDARCRSYDVDTVYNQAFACYFCCMGDNCNSDVIPLQQTLLSLP